MKRLRAATDYLGRLPEGLISYILGLTSPEDAARCSAISLGFKSAAECDDVWEKFLPSHYRDIISKSNSPDRLAYPSKKQLYLSLCDSPFLLDGDNKGKLSFSLDKKTGKHCLMIAPRELTVIFHAIQIYWDFSSDKDSRFGEVATLGTLTRFDLQGKIETRLLSKKTNYVAYLVFKLTKPYAFVDNSRSAVKFVDRESDIEVRRSCGLLPSRDGPSGKDLYKRRADGWTEIELGRFFNDAGGVGDVKAKFMDIRCLLEAFHL